MTNLSLKLDLPKKTDLPNKMDLLDLIKSNSGMALVWLVWRCYSRYIMLLGKQPSQPVFQDAQISQIYLVWQVNFVLTERLNRWVNDELAQDFTLTDDGYHELAEEVVRALAYARDCAPLQALAKMSTSAKASTIDRALDRALTLTLSDCHNLCLDFNLNKARAGIAIAPIAHRFWLAAALADIEYLKNLKPQSPRALKLHLLWPKDLYGHDEGQQTEIYSRIDKFIDQLKMSGFSILADDINAFLYDDLGPTQLEKYQRKMSELELTDAVNIEKALLQGTVKHYGVRILLVGPGGAGKTSLAELLTKGKTKSQKQPTIGVSYQQHQRLDLLLHHDMIKGIDKHQLAQMQLYLWDFGGQAIFHSLHKAFMHENCVYVLVVDSRHEQVPDEWLAQIATVTNNKGKVIVVTNWFDGIKTQQNRVGLMRKFPLLLSKQSFFDFSCLEVKGNGFKRFINQLLQDCLASQREILRETQQAFDILQRQYKTQRFIERDDLAALLCAKLPDQTPSTVPDLLAKLAEFGRFVDVSSDTNEALCLQPEWVIDAAYQLIYAPQLRQNGGIIDLTTIKAISKPLNLDTDSITKLLAFMLQHQVCIQLTAVSGQGKVYFFPDAAQVDEPKKLQRLITLADNLVMYYELAYIPIGVRAKMVSRMMALTEITINPAEVWRDGFMVSLTSDSTQRAQIIVEYHYRQQRIQLTLIKTSDDSEGKNSGELLAIIDRELEQAIGRKVLNYLVLDGRNQQSSDQQKSYSQTVINHFYNGSNQYQGVSVGNKITTIGNVSGSLVNTGDKVNIKANMNSHNQQPQMNADQRAVLLAVIKQAMAEVATNQFNSSHMMILSQAATALDQSSDQLPEVADPHTNGLLTEIWTVMKNIDAVAAMAEKSHKYLAPYVATALTYLGSLGFLA